MLLGKIKRGSEHIIFDVGLAWPSTQLLIPINAQRDEQFISFDDFLKLDMEWVWMSDKEKIIQIIQDYVLRKWSFEPQYEELRRQKQEWMEFVPKLIDWVERQIVK